MPGKAKVVVAVGLAAVCVLLAGPSQVLADTPPKTAVQNQKAVQTQQTVAPQKPAVKRTAHKSHKKATATPLPPYTPRTLAPLPLEQMPSVPPEVTYKNDKLTILAHNSTLGDILRAVHAQTGAELDVPASANERVVAKLGPGPARDVLATLLNGTHFNYVMLGSPSDPTSVQRVVLTAKTGADTTTTAVNTPPPNQGMPPNRFQQPMVAQQSATQEGEAADDNSADAQDDSNADNADDQQQADQQQGDQQQQNGQQAPKTPEQLLQELLQQQQQQQAQPGQPPQPGQPQMVYPNPVQPPPDNEN